MEKHVWKAHIKEGMVEEYIRRHDEIWPEMVETLKEAGITNYTIWNTGTELFGYYECEKGYAYAEKYQKESPVVARWNVYMADVMDFDTDENGNQLEYHSVFYLA